MVNVSNLINPTPFEFEVWKNRDIRRAIEYNTTINSRNSIVIDCLLYCDGIEVDRIKLREKILSFLEGDHNISLLEAIMLLEALQLMNFEKNAPLHVKYFITNLYESGLLAKSNIMIHVYNHHISNSE
jgi:hypothetical protein